MGANLPEDTTVITKIVIYMGGVLLGLSAKIASANRKKRITFKEVFVQSSIAFACAWLVWFVISYYGRPDLANVVSVVVGRFADDILAVFFESLKTWFKTASEKISK